MQNNLDITKTIPTGSELRILLNSSHISYGEIHTALKEKGIFVGDSSKKITVPLLASTILTDTEFTRLLDRSIDRESKPKVKVSNLDLCAPKSDWTTPLKGIFGLDKFDPAHDIESIEFKSRPRLTINSPDKATIKYTAHRRDISQDLIKRELTFTGELTIERNDKELKLYTSSEHTAPETEKINNRLLSHLSRVLKESGIVSKESPSKITFGLFSNKERILFFKRLAGGLSPSLTLGNVNDIEVSLNKEGVPLPNDPKIDWMKDTVNRVKIDGKRLNNIFLIDDDAYYNYYYILKMEINYSYELGINRGDCRVCFLFTNLGKELKNRSNSELSFEISRVTHQKQVNQTSKIEIHKNLTKCIEKLVLATFKTTAISHTNSSK